MEQNLLDEMFLKLRFPEKELLIEFEYDRYGAKYCAQDVNWTALSGTTILNLVYSGSTINHINNG